MESQTPAFSNNALQSAIETQCSSGKPQCTKFVYNLLENGKTYEFIEKMVVEKEIPGII